MTLTDQEIQQRFDFGKDLIVKAGELAMSYFNSLETLDIKSKGPQDFVSEADYNTEVLIKDAIKVKFPDDAFFGEETGPSGITGAQGIWVVDPIDGTRGYVSGTPTWGTLIALNDGNEPIFGMIDQPYTGERFVGGFGMAFMERHGVKTPLATRRKRHLSEATIFTTFPEVGSPLEAEAFHAVAGQCQLTRYGMDCYAYALLAAGQIDLVIEAGLQAYDIQAPMALVQAAGGVVSDWRGGNPMNGGRCICAATPELHAAALEILREVPLG